MIDYGLPDGMEVSRGDSGGFELAVTMPTDEDEFFGREHPSCEQHFRIAAEGYQSLRDDQDLWCVCCEHRDEIRAFITAQHLEPAKHAASDYAVGLARDHLHKAFQDAFGRPSRQAGNSFIRIAYRADPKCFYPSPLPSISEERLHRDRVCDTCGLRYAVSGEHRFCPISR